MHYARKLRQNERTNENGIVYFRNDDVYVGSKLSFFLHETKSEYVLLYVYVV